jgi:hypothetical protein
MPKDGAGAIPAAQLACMPEGIDWRSEPRAPPVRAPRRARQTRRPASAG